MRSTLCLSTLVFALSPITALAQDTALATWEPKTTATTEAQAEATTDGEAAAAIEAKLNAQVEEISGAPATEPGAVTTESAANVEAASVNASLIGAPLTGKAQVVFFRPAKFAGSAVGFKVREGEAELGKLRSGKYFIHFSEPGTYEYTVHSEAKDVLTIEVEAGETYYVQGTLTMGLMVGRPNLSPSDATTFNGMADKLKLAK